MELREFISQTLVQIQQGVQDAISQRTGPEANGVINPVFSQYSEDIGASHVQKVEFDVAVTVTDKDNGGKAGIKVFSVELNGERSKGYEHTIASRVKFTIPVIPPVQLVRPS